MPAPSGTVSASEGVAGETHVEGNAEGERQRSPIQAILSGISVWDVPLERRKQTAAVALFVSSLIFIPGCFVTSLLLLFHPLSRIPVIIYLLYITLLDSSTITGARKSDFFRRLPMFKHYANYFPVKLHKTADLDPDHRYVIGYHPHGIIGIGAIASFASEGPGISQLLPGLDIYLLTLAINFRVPLLREIWLLMGLCDSSKRTFRTILSRGSGSAVVVVVGGAAEALQAAPGTMDLILEQRRGFVRQALLNDALLVPAIGFGETDIFDVVTTPWMLRVQERLQKLFGFAMPLFHGRGVFNYRVGILPHRRPINVVVDLVRLRGEIRAAGEPFLQNRPRC